MINTKKLFKHLLLLKRENVCEQFLQSLQRADLLNGHCLDFTDLAGWLVQTRSLERVLHFTQAVEDPSLFAALSARLRGGAGAELCSAEELRQSYASLRAAALQSS